MSLDDDIKTALLKKQRPTARYNVKYEQLHSAHGVQCRQCAHCKEREVLLPQCTRYTVAKVYFSPTEGLVNQVSLPRFCHAVRLDESACGWRAKGFERLIVKDSIFMGAKYSDDE